MTDNKAAIVDEFINITGADNDRSIFFLETANWNLELALSTFFEDAVEMEEDEDNELEPMDSPPPTKPTNHSTATPSQKKTAPIAGPKSRIHTLGGMSKTEASSDEEGQTFYAGGSERGGGQQIIGPKKKADGKNIVEDLFKNAKEHGAEVVQKSTLSKASTSRSIFRGKAYKLGDPAIASTAVESSEEDDIDETVDVTLKFWRNGFSIDDGPLKQFDDPANVSILEDIKKGQLPKELLNQHRGKMVNVNMEDRSSQEFVRPKTTMVAFSGASHRLGNPTDPMSTGQTSNLNPAKPAVHGENLESAAHSALGFDFARPVISFQLRLLDGSRIVIKLNENHTIADIRTYLNIIKPEYVNISYIFMTTFPSKQLDNETLDLKTAGLNNNQIVLKLK